ncbi:Efk-1 [Aphelenchoides fujianensis]|nr:Efk-1 [Aphelenchoides fujianensis]
MQHFGNSTLVLSISDHKRRKSEMSQKANKGGGDADESVGSDIELLGDEVLSWMSESVDLDSSGWERATPTPQVLREQNKRLRPIYAEADQKYGEDAKTAEEMLQRRRQAIKIRNEQLFKRADDHPDGDPKGLTAAGIFKKIADCGIDYYFGKITDLTDKMLKAFSDALGNPIDQFDVQDILEICDSVIAAVSMSVGNSLRKTGPSARPERDYRLDSTVPTTWDAYVIQNGKLIAYQYPNSIQDVVDDVPLDRCRPEVARIQMTAQPFGRGSERIAYYARDLQTGKDVVLKDYRRLMSAGAAGRQHEFANQLQTIASYFAALYMADCEEVLSADKIPAILQFLMIKTLAIGSGANVRYMSCEPLLDTSVYYD